MVVAAGTLEAVPAYARQMKSQCSTCHFQHYPTLNAFGRSFKASGYTMSAQENIEGDNMSLSPNLNASLFIKTRYQKTNGTDGATYDPTDAINWMKKEPTTNSGQVQFPDEFALLFGGRVSENMGFLAETGGAGEGGPFFLSVKAPIMFDALGGKIGFIPFFTDGLGVAYGFELLNTGAVRNIRPFEHRSDTSAQQYLGTDGAAQGGAFVYVHDKFHINFTKWNQSFQTTALNTYSVAPNLNYVRLGVTPGEIAGFDVGFGVQVWSGKTRQQVLVETESQTEVLDADGNSAAVPLYLTTTTETAELRTVAAKAHSFDLQLQGDVGIPVGVYFSHAVAPASEFSNHIAADPAGGLAFTFEPSTPNSFNSGRRNKRATTLSVELGVLPRMTVGFGVRVADNGSSNVSENDYTVADLCADYEGSGAVNCVIDIPGAPGINLRDLRSVYIQEPTKSGHTLTTEARNKDNALFFALNFTLAQNVHLHLEHSRYSGNRYNSNGNNAYNLNSGSVNPSSGPWAVGEPGDQLTTFMLSVGF